MSTPRYKAIIFDMDGTLLDTLEDLADSMNHVLAMRGYPPKTLDEVRMLVGYGIEYFAAGALPKEALEQADEEAAAEGAESGRETLVRSIVGDMRAYYQTHSDIKTHVYDGVMDMLTRLKEAGVRTAVLSNKPDPAVVKLSPQYFAGIFDIARGERRGIPRKPAPEPTLAIVREWGLSPEEVAYVGDGDTDILTAKNAGLDLIAVSWGYRGKAYLAERGAKVILDSPEEVAAYILNE